MSSEELTRTLAELRNRLTRDMEILAKTQMNMLQTAITQELLSGRRTVAELTEAIFLIKPGDAEYNTQYSRIRREIRLMESRGFVVSRKPFGRDKPYSPTQLAIARLTRIEGVRSSSWEVFPRRDKVVYGAVIALGVILLWMTAGGAEYGVGFLALAFAFFFMGGIAFCRFIEAIGRVT